MAKSSLVWITRIPSFGESDGLICKQIAASQTTWIVAAGWNAITTLNGRVTPADEATKALIRRRWPHLRLATIVLFGKLAFEERTSIQRGDQKPAHIQDWLRLVRKPTVAGMDLSNRVRFGFLGRYRFLVNHGERNRANSEVYLG
jgi:hypothetical protein